MPRQSNSKSTGHSEVLLGHLKTKCAGKDALLAKRSHKDRRPSVPPSHRAGFAEGADEDEDVADDAAANSLATAGNLRLNEGFAMLWAPEAAASRRFSASVDSMEPVVGVVSNMNDNSAVRTVPTDHRGFHVSG